jgi:hypothetical protein
MCVRCTQTKLAWLRIAFEPYLRANDRYGAGVNGQANRRVVIITFDQLLISFRASSSSRTAKATPTYARCSEQALHCAARPAREKMMMPISIADCLLIILSQCEARPKRPRTRSFLLPRGM